MPRHSADKQKKKRCKSFLRWSFMTVPLHAISLSDHLFRHIIHDRSTQRSDPSTNSHSAIKPSSSPISSLNQALQVTPPHTRPAGVDLSPDYPNEVVDIGTDKISNLPFHSPPIPIW
ncbi:hypothetical protein AVEN_40122-1 [Araneus ventricosus]|uniref:Uncharacterized protein n=1 Tax=Araneus ventricosus TaxID=182803 RepID=A0A4Y2ELR1_ARAVE|nr:hypothetical protein AVEN_40122-1 [Araneus ventricosus]